MKREEITAYLFNEIPEAEREKIEKSYLQDEMLLEEILLVEADLIDSYIAGELSSEKKQKFEQIYLSSPILREKVEMVRGLTQYATRRNRHSENIPSRVWQYAFVPLLLVLVLSVGIFFMAYRQMQEELRIAESQNQVLQKQLARQLEFLQEQLHKKARNEPAAVEVVRNEVPVLAYLITPELFRDSIRTPLLEVPPTVEFVQLDLVASPVESTEYFASLQTVEGKEIYRARIVSIRPERNRTAFGFRVPANQLADGDYIVSLTGSGNVKIREFYFRVIRSS